MILFAVTLHHPRNSFSCNYRACIYVETPVILRCHVSAGWNPIFMAKKDEYIVFSSSCTTCRYHSTKC